jgi:hypothetical protein
LKLPHSHDFQEVWTVRLAGCLEEGDCGSLVVDASTGDIYGQIVAGCPESGVAYIIPAHRIYNHLKMNFFHKLQLSKETADANAQDSEGEPTFMPSIFETLRSALLLPVSFVLSLCYSSECPWALYDIEREVEYRHRARWHSQNTWTDRRRALRLLERPDSHWSWYVTLVAGLGFFTDSYNVRPLSPWLKRC